MASDREMISGRLFRVALLLGVTAVLGAFVVGLLGYRYSYGIIEAESRKLYLGKADHLAQLAVHNQSLSDRELLNTVKSHYLAEKDRPADEYVCVIDEKGILLLHTLHPGTVGNDAGDNLVLGLKKGEGCALRDLPKLTQAHVGGYISSSGQQQIAAFVPVSGKGWTVGVHRSKEALEGEIGSRLNPVFLGLLLVCGIMMPAALVLFFLIFRRTQKERQLAASTLEESESLLRTIARNYPNSYLSIIEQDLTIGFTSGQEFRKQNLDPDQFVGLPLDQVFGGRAPFVRDHFEKTFAGQEQTFELFINDQHQLYKTVPLPEQDGTISRILSVAENITEQKEAAEALRESEERFSLFAQNLPGLVFIKDHHSRYVFANDKYLDFYGWSRADVLGKTSAEVHPRERATVYMESDRELLKTGKPQTKTEIFDQIGDRRMVLVNHKFLIERIDKQPLIAGFYLDITENVQLEEELERLKTVIDNANFGLAMCDLEGNLTYINDSFARVHGYESQELTGENLAIFHSPEQMDRVAELNAKMASDGGYEQEEVWHRRRDGTGFPMLMNGKLITDEAGEPLLMAATAIDITERNQAKNALRDSEERYRSVVDLSPDPVLIHRQGEIIFANRAALKILAAKDQKDVLGMQIWNLVADPVGREAARQRTARQGTGDRVPWHEFNLKRFDGSEVTVESTGRPIPLTGGLAVMTVWRDLTEAKQAEKENELLEAQLRQAQKMEALGTLAGGIAHDFNNILAVINGYSELIIEDAEEDAEYGQYVKEIIRTSRRAKDLVTQILTFSRKLEPDLQPLDLNRVVKQTEKMLERMIPKMIRIELRLDHELGVVNADPSQMSQVLLNLATNARDAMPEGGLLLLRTENVTLGEEQSNQRMGLTPGNYILLTVSDTGQGMDRDTQEHIFDPFFTKKKKGQGTGLGLATVYGIVKNHGGFIYCDSQVGQGATFKLFLPVYALAGEDENGPQTPKIQIEGGEETVLLVDDEANIRALGQKILDRHGYRVLTARTGEEALEIFAREKNAIDLVILDISMPGMGGHKCFQKIRGLDPGVKVIFSSGYSKGSQLKDILETGEASYVPKPYSRVEMLRAVREVLDGPRGN